MIDFLYPLAFVMLIAPFIIAMLPYVYETKKRALYFSDLKGLEKASAIKNSAKPIVNASWRSRFVMYLVYVGLVTALAKPILIGEPIIKEESLREVLICIDLSASMQERDFKSKNGLDVNRLEAQKEVLGEFIRNLKNENFALILYGSSAFVQMPFSNDTNATLKLLEEIQIGMAGPKTAIGDAIGLGIKLFDESKIKDRLMIMMSDGSDSGSKVPPLKAAELAKKADIRIETIAVGDEKAKGEVRVDIDTLEKIAKITDGNFFRAKDTQSLKKIYEEIDRLNPIKVKKHSYRPTKELFPYALLFSLVLVFTYMLFLFSPFFKRVKNV